MAAVNQRRWSWALFAVVLLATVWGWLWVLQRLVRNEAEVAQGRVRVAEELFLAGVAEELLRGVEAQFPPSQPGEEWVPAVAGQGALSGVWFESEEGEGGAPDEEVLEKWRGAIRAGSVTPAEFVAAVRSGELPWGWVEDGRDAVAGMTLSLLRKGEGAEELGALLRERVWKYDGPPLRPAFRFVLIRELQKHGDDPALARLAKAESIRMAEGRVAEMELAERYEILDHEIRGRRVRTYWTRDELEGLIDGARDEKIELLEREDPARAGVRVAGFSRWPVLALRESGGVASSAVQSSGTALLWLGGLTGLAVLLLTIAAALAAGRAQRIARMRTDLAASVAHELRTPLAGQRVLLESLLERKDQTEEEQREYVEMAFRENKRLSRLAEEFLTFSRLERGVLTLEDEEVEVREVVENAAESLREKWEGEDCELHREISEDLPRIAGDGQAIATILRNLLENAWKYSSAPRRITVRAWEDDGGVWLAVEDNGMGIPEKERERVFRQFYRTDRRLARTHEGLGLGLSIVKRLVDAQQGRIEVESKEGEGSEFRVWFRKVS